MRLPDFVIIGAPRAGTSSLWAILRQIPEFHTWPKKEVHFFDRHWSRGIAWYADRFAAAPQGAKIFEATPAYLFRKNVPARAAATLPNARFYCLLREPVARAVSHYWLHQDKFGRDPEALISSRHPAVTAGHYAEHLKRWLEHVPRERLIVYPSELFFAQPLAYARHIALENGGPEKPLVSLRAAFYDPLKHRKQKYGTPRMPKAVLSWLRLHYRPHNERLRDLLAPYDITKFWYTQKQED